jgi:hypothetical protein
MRQGPALQKYSLMIAWGESREGEYQERWRVSVKDVSALCRCACLSLNAESQGACVYRRKAFRRFLYYRGGRKALDNKDRVKHIIILSYPHQVG